VHAACAQAFPPPLALFRRSEAREAGPRLTISGSFDRCPRDEKIHWRLGDYASGVYFYRMETDGQLLVGKVLAIR